MTIQASVASGLPGNTIERFAPYAAVPGRALLASLFILSGAQKIGAYEAMVGYMNAFGVPGALLPAVIALEIVAGVALLVGFGARVAAVLLAGFSLVAAFVFHFNFADQIQAILFMKNVAIAGGLFVLAAAGPGPLSIDRRF